MNVTISVLNTQFDTFNTQNNKDLRKDGLVEEFKKNLHDQNQDAANTFNALIKYGYQKEVYKIFAESLASSLSVDLRLLEDLGIRDTRHPSFETVKKYFSVALPDRTQYDNFFLNAFNDNEMISLLSEQLVKKIQSPSTNFSNLDNVINYCQEIRDNLTGINAKKVIENENVINAVAEVLSIPLSDLEKASKIYDNICDIFPKNIVEQIFNDKRFLDKIAQQMSEDYHFCQSQVVYNFLRRYNVKLDNLFNAVLKSDSDSQGLIYDNKYQRRIYIIRNLSELASPEELKDTLIKGKTLRKMKENFCDALIETDNDGVIECTYGIKTMLKKLHKLVALSAPESINSVVSPFFGKSRFGRFIFDPYVYGRVKDAIISAASEGNTEYIKKISGLFYYSFLDKVSDRIFSSKGFAEAIIKGHTKISKEILNGDEEASLLKTLKELDNYIKGYSEARKRRHLKNDKAHSK